jgi:hypothetical protein
MAYWNRFDICEAYYLYACDFHRGQNSKEYKIFGRLDKIGFRPSPLLSISTLSKSDRQNVRDILAGLIKRHRNKDKKYFYPCDSDCVYVHNARVLLYEVSKNEALNEMLLKKFYKDHRTKCVNCFEYGLANAREIKEAL